MNKFKILLNTYPVAYQKMGGGEKQLEQYFNFLKKKKIFVKKFDQWSKTDKLENYDIVHFFSVIPGGSITFLQYAKNLNKKIVISPNIWLEDNKHEEFNQIKYILHLADKIIVNSNLEKLKISKIFEIPLIKFEVIYNCVDNTFLKKKEKIKSFSKMYNIKKPYILSVGNIEKRKNQNAILKVLNKFKKLNYVNIGNTRDEKYLKEFMGKKNKFYNIKYIKNKKILRSAYEESELFILPSECETPSISALEAGAVGKKVIITEIGSTREYFKNYAKYINPYNTNSIYSELKKGLTSKNNYKLKVHIAKNFYAEAQMSKLLQIYKKLYENSY